MTQEVQSCSVMDCAVLSRLHSLCFPKKWQVSEFETLLSMPGVFARLIRDTGRHGYGGFALARIAREEGEIISIGVVPSCRGKGLGKKLLRSVETECRNAGSLELLLEVAETNDLAILLYKSLNFEIVGRRIGYYGDECNSKTDALIMRRSLI